jgi:hypothetical protein
VHAKARAQGGVIQRRLDVLGLGQHGMHRSPMMRCIMKQGHTLDCSRVCMYAFVCVCVIVCVRERHVCIECACGVCVCV